ncbi:hypothetical protein BKA93DRAFT_750356 [Sparassis latifolia]
MSLVGASEAELVQLAYDNITSKYCSIAVAALLFFEHAITLPDEVNYIWRHKKTGVAVLFISNYFLGVVSAFSTVVGIPPWSTNPKAETNSLCPSCDATLLLLAACEELLFIEWAIFSAFWVYAVGGQAWLPAAVVFILSLVPFATNLVLLISPEQR